MKPNDQRLRLTSSGGGLTGFMNKLATFVVGAFMLVGVFMLSVFVIATAAAFALLIGGYVLWKTRAIRRQVREWSRNGRERVIEGEVVQSDAGQQRSEP